MFSRNHRLDAQAADLHHVRECMTRVVQAYLCVPDHRSIKPEDVKALDALDWWENQAELANPSTAPAVLTVRRPAPMQLAAPEVVVEKPGAVDMRPKEP